MTQALPACPHCGSPVQGEYAPHLCAACGRPQHVEKGEDAFNAFSVPRRFSSDLKAIERRFYALSRALHPDRFAGSGPAMMAVSLERMSFLNQALNVFRSPELLRETLLRLEGIEAPTESRQVPLELAESWFELQDAIMDAPATALSRISIFEDDLLERQDVLNAKLAELERHYDEILERSILSEISKLLQERSYLFSMGRDVIQLKNRLQTQPEGSYNG